MTARPRSRTRRIALLLLSLLVACAVLEVAWRVRLRVAGTPWDATAARARVTELASSMLASVPDVEPGDEAPGREELRALSPYYGWESPQSQQALLDQAAFFRGPERAKVFSVLVLGGSVGEHLGRAVRREDAMTPVLAKLAKVNGREVQLLFWARGSFKQPQQEMLCSYLFALGIVPDAVVEVDGFNEVALGNDNAKRGVHPLLPHWPMWGRLASGRTFGPEALHELGTMSAMRTRIAELQDDDSACASSAVLGTLWRRRAEAMHARFVAAQERFVAALGRGDAGSTDDPARGPTFTGDALAECVRGWEASSRSMQALCASRGVAYLHVLQPTMHDAGSKPLTDDEKARGKADASWIEGAKLGYPMLRDAGARLAASGVAFADLSRLFEDERETAYVDCCHFRGPSMQRFAKRIAEELATVLSR